MWPSLFEVRIDAAPELHGGLQTCAVHQLTVEGMFKSQALVAGYT